MAVYWGEIAEQSNTIPDINLNKLSADLSGMHLPEWPHWNCSAVHVSALEIPLPLPPGGNRIPGKKTT
jgi:hypothetical protein